MIQDKKLKRNATYAIAEVAEVALCASNCALPTSEKYYIQYNGFSRKRNFRNQSLIVEVFLFSNFFRKMFREIFEHWQKRASCLFGIIRFNIALNTI